MHNIFSVTGQKRFDAVDKFLHGEGQCKHGIAHIFIDHIVITFKNKNDGEAWDLFREWIGRCASLCFEGWRR